nr:T9SS type A sorting domain-containing protein [Ignavibacteriaceae bacterium]
AGVCALILQKNPSLTPMQVLQVLRSTASRSNNPDNQYGWGIINALSAINSLIVPVEMTLFSGDYENERVNLKWITATELNNFGFEIERRDDFSSYEKIGFVSGNGTSTNRITYNFIDQNLSAKKYYYRLKQLDLDGTFDYSSEIAVDIEMLKDFKLFQNYPNPFNPTTNIKYYVPDAGKLKIGLYDVLGNELTTLVNKEVQAGLYEMTVDGTNLASGTYFVKMISQNNQQTIKISLIK